MKTSGFGIHKKIEIQSPDGSSNVQPESDFEVANSNETPSIIGIKAGRDVNVTGNVKISLKLNNTLKKIVTSFRLIDTPISNFVGRKNLLHQIHDCFQKSSLKTRYDERIVVIHGFGGIGKSEVARKYVEEYINDPIIQNGAWIDSQNEKSLKASFVSLAKKLKLKISSEVDEIAKDVYQHFSDHVQIGLFIFDNSLQMKNSDKHFGISKYLPTQLLEKLPLILITARTNKWNIPKENIIKVQELDQEDSITFLTMRLNLTNIQIKNDSILRSVRKLARALEGYPLGLTLAASNIDNEELLSDLCEEIDNYLKRMEMPTEERKWVEDTLSEGDPNNYPLIMSNVWKTTLEKIESCDKSCGEEAIQLLKVLAYVPAYEENQMEEIKEIFEFIFSKELHEKSYFILSKFSLISIHEEKYTNGLTYSQIRIHRLVQHYTRNKQQDDKDDTAVIQYCVYLSHEDRHLELRGIFEYLKNHWPANTSAIHFSILLCFGWLRKVKEREELLKHLQCIFDYFQINNNQHFLLEKDQMKENDVKLMMLSLYCYQHWQKGFLDNNIQLQDLQINDQRCINDFAMTIFKSYFEHLLHSSTIRGGRGMALTKIGKIPEGPRLLPYAYTLCTYIYKALWQHMYTWLFPRFLKIPSQSLSTINTEERQESSQVSLKNVHQMCYQMLVEGKNENSPLGVLVPILQLLIQLICDSTCGFGRKETAKELYNLIGVYLSTKNQDMSSYGVGWNCILQIHKHVYPTIGINLDEGIKSYWQGGGPNKYLNIMKWSSSDIQLLFQKISDTNDVYEFLAHYMQYLRVYTNRSKKDIQDFFYFGMPWLYKLGFPEELVSCGVFMEHFHSFVLQHFPEMNFGQQTDCIVAFLGFFSKKKTLEDKNGFSWSINCVADQMKSFSARLNPALKGLILKSKERFVDSKSWNKIVWDFLQIHKCDNDLQTKVALEVATYLVEEEKEEINNKF